MPSGVQILKDTYKKGRNEDPDLLYLKQYPYSSIAATISSVISILWNTFTTSSSSSRTSMSFKTPFASSGEITLVSFGILLSSAQVGTIFISSNFLFTAPKSSNDVQMKLFCCCCPTNIQRTMQYHELRILRK